jgi:hypothetical protein
MTALWEIETEFWIDRDFPPEVAHWLTIVRWMEQGDLRPLAAAIRKGDVDRAVLNHVVKMIDANRLRVVPRKRGSPKKPEALARDLLLARAYESRPGKSETRIEDIAKAVGMSHQVVRQAITRWRKFKNQAPDGPPPVVRAVSSSNK